MLTGRSPKQLEHHLSKLLSGVLLFVLLFAIITLLILVFFNPERSIRRTQYAVIIGGAILFLVFAYHLNRTGRYYRGAQLLVACAALMPWASLIVDPAILRGDFVPLIYVTFSVLLSSILLTTLSTSILAICQFIGVSAVFLFSPATIWFNWFSFLAYVFLASVFSILSNSILQRYVKQIDDQANLLLLNEARLQELSIRDHLTNLFNRRHMEELLEREIHLATRKQASLGVMMLDLDNLKPVNDILGHGAGDLVLQLVSRLLLEQVRQTDFVCRFGGDEFILMLPDVSMDVVMERAEHLRERTERFFVEHRDEWPITITISIGVAVFPAHGSTGPTILKSADAALYEAKRNGRNRVALAP